MAKKRQWCINYSYVVEVPEESKSIDKCIPFCVSTTTWIANDTNNLAWQILHTKTKILSLFAESLLWQIKGAGKYKQSIFCNCGSSGLCADATLKALFWWFTVPSQGSFHSDPLTAAYMMLKVRQKQSSSKLFCKVIFFNHSVSEQQYCRWSLHYVITLDSPVVERRNWGEPSLSWWSEVWVKAWKVALLVSVSPTLWERVMSLCNIRQVTFNIDWKSRPVWSIWSRYCKYLQLRETEFKSDKECMVNALKHIMYGLWPKKEHVIYSMKRSWEKLLGGGGKKVNWMVFIPVGE